MITIPQIVPLKPGPTLQTRNPLNPKANNRPFPSSSSSSSSSISNPSLPSMALILSRPKHRSLTNPSLFHLFSSSSSTTPPTNDHPSPEPPFDSQPQTSSSFSSYLSDVKASLKHQSPKNPPSQNDQNTPKEQSFLKPANANPTPPGRVASLEEIRNNLSQFRMRSSAPSPTEPNSTHTLSQQQQQQQQQRQLPQQHISFLELYKRNVISNPDSAGPPPSRKPGSPEYSFNAIRESLKNMRLNQNANANPNVRANSFSGFRSSLRLKPEGQTEGVKSTVIGGTQELPSAIFGKEKEEEGTGKEKRTTEFVRSYTHQELGTKLRSLRPEVKGKEKGKGWFSLEELNERLKKLRELELEDSSSKIGGVTLNALRQSLVIMKNVEEEAEKKSVQRLNLVGQLRGPDYKSLPPQEHLVEKYFHQDNMSSAEKMKIKLAKVRDEFKMSESDCGSARVQVALLTTKIKHLSSLLHKKDKHSRKGLLGMVQKRKKLLKYLRRTDWDSYCFVLSKLGLRDNPDYKHLA